MMIVQTWRLMHIYYLRNIAIEKSSFHIQFMNTPKLRNCKAMNHPNCGLFDHQTKSSTTINASLLPSTIAHKTIVISFKRTIKLNFVFENLQILNNISINRMRHKFSHLSFNKSIQLIFDGQFSIRIVESIEGICR